MLVKRGLMAFSFAILTAAPAVSFAQGLPAGAAPAPQAPPRRAGGFVPGQKRPPENPEMVARGNKIYGVSCRGCHGADLRGGDMGGPNLLRSQLALSDREGEKIVPVIHGSLQASGMPAIPMNDDDAKAVASYVRSVLETIGGQGTPPAAGVAPPTIVVGNAAEGQAYFAAKCASCHSATGDLAGIATRIPDPKMLQNAWVAGGRRGGRGGPAAPRPNAPVVTATVTTTSGEKVEGKVIRLDDFLVALELADGTTRSFRRDGDVPKVVVNDPMSGHRDLLATYTDKDIHDVTAYLVTLK